MVYKGKIPLEVAWGTFPRQYFVTGMMELSLPSPAWAMACVIRLTAQPAPAPVQTTPAENRTITILSHFRRINVFSRMHNSPFGSNDGLQTRINNASEDDKAAQLIKPQSLQWMSTSLLFQWTIIRENLRGPGADRTNQAPAEPTEAALKLSYSYVNYDPREMNPERQCSGESRTGELLNLQTGLNWFGSTGSHKANLIYLSWGCGSGFVICAVH